MCEFVDTLIEPPVVGKFYQVRTVMQDRWRQFAKVRLPIMGSRHSDDDLGAPVLHWHVDPRFLPDDLFIAWLGWLQDGTLVNTDAFQEQEPEISIMECRRLGHWLPTHLLMENALFSAVHTPFFGKQCKHRNGGWICPHKGYNLANQEALNGIITCPLHGLQVDASTGIVVRTR